MRLSSYHKILTGFVLVMAAATLLAVAALGWLLHMEQQLDVVPATAVVPAIRMMIRQGYGLILAVGAGGTLISCGCVWWVWSTLGRVLRSVGQALQVSSAHVLDSVNALSHDSQQLADNAIRAAATIGETSQAIDQLATITKHNASSAGVVKQLAGEARTAVDASATEMQALASAMQAIEASGGEVANIVHVLNEISFQTNLLALNAAVEAAHAGEKGQGFAVVAKEVHALAQRSSDSSREIAERVQAVGSKTRQGVELAGRVATRLQHVVHCNQKLDTLAAEVAADSSEQEQGINHLRTACAEMKGVTEGNAATAENAAGAASDLREEAGSLREAVLILRNLVEGEGTAEPIRRQPSRAELPPAESYSTEPCQSLCPSSSRV
jgi:methyl-accepting chemotaxis protein